MSILITRPSPAGEALVSRLRALGQVAWSFPLIEFVAGRDLPTLADRLATLTENDLVFALSQHAVAFAHAQLQRDGRNWPVRRAISRLAAPRRSPFIPLAGSIFVIHWIGKSAKPCYNYLNYKILRANAR
ncbi:uroporphyrinogen III synthase [Salmonella enterica subsp. enterica]|uniref:Uroporphyrinogen III synthase n=1 Tax=Salmonella enterica I TaxID=59201 RepID=A0A379WIL0_SALET|nr:uroporphyrinogen III synthase [Salmonella enterica subsp. enterica]